MSLMGRAAMVAWHDLRPGSEAEHDDWHSRQHLFERVAISGFRRGRRCRAILAEEEYFLMYEVDDLSALASREYLARLNDPTEWSRRIIPSISNMTRTLCRVLASAGGGVGTAILTLRLAAKAAPREDLIEWIADRQVPELPGRRGIVGAHLLEGDDSASGVKTDEMHLRGGGDRIADLVLLVEGYDPDALRSLLDEQLSVASLVEHGAEAERHVGLYRAVHIVTEADLP
jgi:hypothetical protein